MLGLDSDKVVEDFPLMLRVSTKVALELIETLAVLKVGGGEEARNAGGGERYNWSGLESASGLERVREARARGTAVTLETDARGSGDGDAERFEFVHCVKIGGVWRVGVPRVV